MKDISLTTNNGIDRQNYQLIKKSLDVSSARGRVINNNISNANVKGYKRHYVEFEENLKKNKEDLDLKFTKNKHISTESEYGKMEIKRDDISSMREDGNNVDIDIEKVNQAANTLMYNALISQLNNRISTKRYIISNK
ncbi:flagellar basal body rod protein FlgB [Clostridium cochlearium]|uniref:Flagellar basal body rod protein FlgB n=1 Tax=Clostridium cochlearium TaxID=1494 RepID=A0A2X2W4C6_CLOCO|nr:flagellar basal body rod protein FlgB [Clostridium cochlearium]MDU1442795.1 flagellar basal body rod protein FlgB [Clostridium cochlearium]SQB35698.1 flagellar basal-body rod protein FlgB [Clostridium cochlearium]